MPIGLPFDVVSPTLVTGNERIRCGDAADVAVTGVGDPGAIGPLRGA